MLPGFRRSQSLFLVGCLFLIRVYQVFLRPLFSLFIGTPAGACRFSPSCSHYALEAFQRHGVLKGFYLTAGRLLRCHPWSKGGWDPVSDKGV